MLRKSKKIATAMLVATLAGLSFGQLKVEMKDNTASAPNQTQPIIKITNTSPTESIGGFTVRLWFSKDEFPSQTIVVDKYYSNPAGITLSTEPSTNPGMPNVTAVTIVYPASFVLGPGESTIPYNLQFCVHFKNWYPGNWNKLNDWSYQGISGSFVETANVTVYNNDNELIYGSEPEETSCPPGPPELKVEIKDNAPWDGGTSSPRIRITNLSDCKALDGGFKVRFWFSKEEYSSQTVVADKWYANPGITLSVGNGEALNLVYVEAVYPAGYTLSAGTATDPEGLQFGVHFKNYWPGVWTKTNDYSWQGITTTFGETMFVTVYDNADNLIYGIEP